MKRGSRAHKWSGFSLIEVMVAISILTIAMLATLDFSTMLTKQQVTLESKNTNLSNAKLVESTFDSSTASSINAIRFTFRNGVASYGKFLDAPNETYSIKNESNGLLFEKDDVKLQLASMADYTPSPSIAQASDFWTLIGQWTIPSAFGGGPIVYSSAPPLTGVVAANFNVIAKVRGIEALQIIRQAIRVYFTFEKFGSVWRVDQAFSKSYLDVIREKCSVMGNAFRLKAGYNPEITRSDLTCIPRQCGEGHFKLEECVIVSEEGLHNKDATPTCVDAGVFANTDVGREAACANRSSDAAQYHSKYFNYITNQQCPPGKAFNNVVMACTN